VGSGGRINQSNAGFGKVEERVSGVKEHHCKVRSGRLSPSLAHLHGIDSQ
jgi:hypothetical protein